MTTKHRLKQLSERLNGSIEMTRKLAGAAPMGFIRQRGLKRDDVLAVATLVENPEFSSGFLKTVETPDLLDHSLEAIVLEFRDLFEHRPLCIKAAEFKLEWAKQQLSGKGKKVA